MDHGTAATADFGISAFSIPVAKSYKVEVTMRFERQREASCYVGQVHVGSSAAPVAVHRLHSPWVLKFRNPAEPSVSLYFVPVYDLEKKKRKKENGEVQSTCK